MCKMLKIDPWDIPSNFCFYVQAQNSFIYLGHLPCLNVVFQHIEIMENGFLGIPHLEDLYEMVHDNSDPFWLRNTGAVIWAGIVIGMVNF